MSDHSERIKARGSEGETWKRGKEGWRKEKRNGEIETERGGGRRDKGRKRTSFQDETTIFYNLLVYSGLVVQ